MSPQHVNHVPVSTYVKEVSNVRLGLSYRRFFKIYMMSCTLKSDSNKIWMGPHPRIWFQGELMAMSKMQGRISWWPMLKTLAIQFSSCLPKGVTNCS